MKRLLMFLAVCLGLMGGVKAQTAKAASDIVDTIYLTYRLSAEDTAASIYLYIIIDNPLTLSLYCDWGDTIMKHPNRYVDAERREISFVLEHSWKMRTGEVRVKIYGMPKSQLLRFSNSASSGKGKLVQVDLTGCTALTDLTVDEGQLTELDVSSCTALEYLECSRNQLTELDVSKNSALKWLNCAYNHLTDLDLSQNTNFAVGSLFCEGNSFVVIRGENETFDFSTRPNFDVTRTQEWKGGTISGNTLTFHKDTVTYQYDVRSVQIYVNSLQTFKVIRKLGDTVPSPVFTPNGGEYDFCSGGVVTINSEIEGTTIYYRYGDSTVWKEYTEPIPIIDTCPIKAKAVHNRYITESPEVEVRFIPKKTVKPVITPSGGAVKRNSTVTISCDTADATIHYTLNGSEPTEQSAVYTAPIVINEGMTIKARSLHRCYAFSEVAEASFTIMPEMAKPVFTPNGGEVERGSTVAIHCDTANATIHYTLDGSVPTEGSAVYSTPIVINEAMTIKAMAVRENYVNSAVATATFTIKSVDPIEPETPDTVAKPVFTPNGGAVERGSTVAIHCDTANATIHYTLDGSVPTEGSAVYSTPIVINEAMTLKAMAVRENYVNSEVATATFMIKSVDPIEPETPDTVAKPVFTPNGGEVERGSTVAIHCDTANAIIHYTVDGSVPTEGSAVYSTPIVINEAMTIKAMAVRENYVNSAVATATFTIKSVDPIEPETPDTVAKPVFTPNGGAVERGSTVAIHCDTANATIHYTVDGSVPTEGSAVYSTPIVINEAMTIKAMAVRENYVNSAVATATFTIKPDDPVDPIEPEKSDTVAKPVFTPNGGEVERGSTVAIHCDTANATIHYTVDGSVPTEGSTVYRTPIVINEAMTIKAMAMRENYVNSPVATATFTIASVANEAGQAVSLVVYAQDRTICLSEAAGEVSVYTVDGRRVFCGNATRIPVSAGGIYIVHVAGKSYKLPVM